MMRISRLYLGVFIFILCGCHEKVRIVNGKIAYSPVNGLQVNVNFTTSKKSNAFIEYWVSDSVIIRTDTSLNSEKHEFNLLKLIPSTAYKYKVMIDYGGSYEGSKISRFQTYPLPEEIPNFIVEVGDSTVFDGYIFLRKHSGKGSQLMINSRGEVVWYQMTDSSIYRPYSLVSNNSYLALKNDSEILELNFEGDTLLQLKRGIGGFDKYLHHEVFKNEDGNIVALTKEKSIVDFSEFGGLVEDTVEGDGILILDSLGRKVWSWSVFDVVETLYTPSIVKSKKDWGHANSLAYDTDGNFLVSFRNFNQIWKINSRDGSIIWKLGENGDFKLKAENLFYQQHAVHLDPIGNIMFFDNGDQSKRNTSRALAFNIDEKCELSLKVELSDSLFSFKQGSAYHIDNEKLLFCSSMTNSIIITDLKGSVLWRASSNSSYYRALYIENF